MAEKNYYLIWVTTQYDGYEWTIHAITSAASEAIAREKAERTDFTHDNGVEVQSVGYIAAITKAEFEVLNRYLLRV